MRRRTAAAASAAIAAATATAVLAPPAFAQNLVVPARPPARPVRVVPGGAVALIAGQVGAPADPNDPTQQQSVYVRDSAAAADQMALAARMERLKEWSKAADIYQEIIDKFTDRVVPSRTDAKGVVTQYTTVGVAVQDKLAKWPAEGLSAYKARFDPVAQSRLQNAKPDDLATLSKVVAQYFVTDAAKAAAIRLMDLQLESGEFAAAAWLGDRLVTAHPGLAADRPMVTFRTALAYHLAGDQPKAQQFADLLRKDSPDAVGTVAGKDTNLATALKADLASPAPSSRANPTATADSWPTFGGDSARSAVSTATGSASARMKAIALTRPTSRGVNRQAANQFRTEDAADRTAGRMLGIIPVADRGELFFQDNLRVFAVSMESGFPLPGWLQTYPGDRNGTFSTSPSAWPTPRDQQLTLTVTDSVVVAVMGLPDRTAAARNEPAAVSGTRLECLDRATGAKRWTCNPRSFDGPFAEFKTIELSGCPAVVGDDVYVAARGTKGNQFEDAYLCCLDLATGKPQWVTYLASANSPGAAGWMDGGAGLTTEAAAHLAAAGGRVYVATNIGALACVDAFSGGILWLDLYPRDAADLGGNVVARIRFNARGEVGNVPGRPWTYNPPVVDDNRVFVLPADSRQLVVYDAGSGAELKRIELSDLTKGDEIAPDTLLSAQGDRVIVAGNTRLFCLDWTRYDHSSFDVNDLANPALVWSKDLPSAIRGRPFVTAAAIYVPTEDHLYQLNARTLKVDNYVPADRPWDPGQGRGNVLVAADHVVIAGATDVELRTDLSMARARLDKLVAADPNDPNSRLVYAETMFNAGKPDLALAQLDEAQRLIGRSPRTAPERAHLFGLCMSFTQSILKDNTAPAASTPTGPGPTPPAPTSAPAANAAALDLADKVFDRAATAAANADEMVQYRLQRARLARAKHDAATEVRLLQEILSSDVLRPVPVADDETGASSLAALIAQREIKELLDAVGPTCYAPYEAEAARALAAAGPEPAVLMNIANTYPNSSAAPKALLAAADYYEAANNPRLAVQTLRQLYFKYPDAPDRPRVLESLARNYLLIPGREDVAVARLAYAAKRYDDRKLTKPLKLPGGRTIENVTFAQALAAARDVVDSRAAAALPDFRLPSKVEWDKYKEAHRDDPDRGKRTLDPFRPEAPGTTVDHVAALIVPARDAARSDRVLAFRPGRGLACYAVGSGQPLWQAKGIPVAPHGAAWAGNDVIAWDDNTVYAIGAAAAGEVAWKLDLRDVKMPEVLSGPEPADQVAADNAANQGPANILNLNLPPNADPALVRRLRAQQLRILQRQQQIIIRNGVVIQQAQFARAAALAGADGPEQIVDVKLTGDRVLIATSKGRIVAAAPAGGSVAWQQRLGNGTLDAFAATDEFVAAKTTDDAQVVLAALDVYTGQVVYRRAFEQSEKAPANLALAPDGTLVYTTYDRLCGKDLYDPSPTLTFDSQPLGDGAPVFSATTAPDQLLIAGPRVLAVSDNGAFVRVHNLADGKPVKYDSPAVGRETDALLKTGAADPSTPVHLRVAANHLYAFSARSLFAYDLDHPEFVWAMPFPSRGMNLKDAAIGQDFLLMTDDPGTNAPHLQAFWRATINDAKTNLPKEAGNWVYDYPVSHPQGVRQILPVDGGLYFVAGNDTLHFLRGARD